jgi:2',3'-cyclic-nucleotide 2'-phosphodiesterase (5'-nucleotidase family)
MGVTPRSDVALLLAVLVWSGGRTAALPQGAGRVDYQLESRPLQPRSGAVEWRDINILHLTDVHSFVAGNRHEGVDADYGDLVSFISHMRDRARERGVELFVVNTGDLVDGTGMSDATPVAGEFLTPILRMVPYDALTIGNHELYEDSTVENLRKPGGLLEHFGERCVTSNQFYRPLGSAASNSSAREQQMEPLSVRHTVLHGPNSGRNLLAFGFLFNFGSFSPNSFVQWVEQAVAEPWFAQAVAAHAAEVVGVAVLAHMGWTDEAVELIRAAVRAAPGGAHLPMVVLAGHTHIRVFSRLDENAGLLESGRYFDTIGMIGFDIPSTTASARVAPADGYSNLSSTWFEYEYLATNVENLAAVAQVEPGDFSLPAGALVKEEISRVREMFALDEVLGCTPADGPLRYRRRNDLDAPDSLWRLALEEVIPAVVFEPTFNPTQILVAGSGGLRFDIYAGELTRDDTMIVSPFRDSFHLFADLSADEAMIVLESLGAAVPGEPKLPSMVASSAPDPGSLDRYSVLALDYDLARVRNAVREATGDVGRTEVPWRHGEIDTTVIWELFVSRVWGNCDSRS